MPRRIYLILTGIALLALLAGLLIPVGVRGETSRKSFYAQSALWRGGSWVLEKWRLVRLSSLTIDQLRERVGRLETENARLKAEQMLLRRFQEENIRLREMVGFQQDSPYRLLACRVVRRDPSTWWSALIINRGYVDEPSLALDQPVVSPRGLVGKIGEVGPYSSRVILLIDENCRISAEVEGSRARGISVGASTVNRGTSRCRLTYVPRESPFQVGERVFTSGLGGTFPPGLLIGTVIEAPALSGDRNFGLFREGLIEPAVDLSNLDELFVVTGAR